MVQRGLLRINYPLDICVEFKKAGSEFVAESENTCDYVNTLFS